MDIEKRLEGLVEVRLVGGFLHGRKAYMASPDYRILMESPSGSSCYRRRIVESVKVNGETLTVATYAPDGLDNHEFTHLVLDAARNGTFKVHKGRSL